MKTLKKPLIALLAFAVVLSLAAVIAIAASPTPQGSLEEMNALIAEVDAAASSREKKKALDAVTAYIQEHEFSVADIDIAQERYDEVCERVSDFTVEDLQSRLAAIMKSKPKESLNARLETNAVQSILQGEGYIAPTDARYAQLYRDVKVVDAFVDLLYIGRDDVEIIERGETLRTFFDKIGKEPLDEGSEYYAAYMQKNEEVVDATITLLYDNLRDCLAKAESTEASEEEILAAVADFRALCERCYFKTEEPEYIALCDRNTLAELKLLVGKVNAAEELFDKGVALKTVYAAWGESGMARNGEEDTESDKAVFFAALDRLTEELTGQLFDKVNGILTDVMSEEPSAERGDLIADYDNWIDNCYFPTGEDRYTLLDGRRLVAETYILLYSVKDAKDDAAEDGGVIEQSKRLRELVDFYTEKTYNPSVAETALLKKEYTDLKAQVTEDFYDHLKELTDRIAKANEDFDAAKKAKDIILSLADEAYFDRKNAKHAEYLEALSASERAFGTKAIDWAVKAYREAMALEDTEEKKLTVAKIKEDFTSYGVDPIDNATSEDDIAFNALYDGYTAALFYAELDLLCDDAVKAYNDEADDLSEYFAAIKAHLATYSYDRTSAEWKAYSQKIKKANDSYQSQLLARADELCTAAEGKSGREQLTAFNLLKAFYNANDFEKSEAYYKFLERYEKISVAASATLAEIKAALEAQVPLSDYGRDSGSSPLTFDSGSVTGANIANGNRVYVNTEDGGCDSAGSLTIDYKSTTPDTYYTWSVKIIESVMVFEFDVTTFTSMPPTVSFCTGATNTDGVRKFPAFFRLSTSNGKTNLVTDQSVVLKEDILTPGVWTHIAMVYNDTTKMIQMYVDYEKAGPEYKESTSGCTNWTLNEGLRLGGRSAREDVSVSFDNLTYYPGSVPRTTDRFTKMENDEKFLFFGNFLEEYAIDPDAHDIADVNYAYTQMNTMLSSYWSTSEKTYLTEDLDLRHSVDIFLSIEQAKINEQMKDIVFNELKALYDALFALESTTDTISSRSDLIDQIDSYIETNSSTLDQTTDKYKALVADVDAERARLVIDERVSEFKNGIIRFRRATSLVAMKRHYATCETAYGDGFDAETILRFSDLADLIEEYEGFYDDLMSKTREANAKSIVECMKLVALYSEDEYEEKYDEINTYIVIVRSFLTPAADGSLQYQQNYLGISSAIKLYNRVNDFFYQRLQLEHVAKLQAQIDKYSSLDSYIEKLGVVMYVRNYVAANDVDKENDAIRKILEACAVYEQELGMKDGEVDPDLPNYQLEKYEKLIEQNTVYFVDIVTRMALIDGYSELKAMYDSAMEIYFYMNIDSEEVKAALTVFNSYESILREMETHSKLFIEAMEAYAIAETATDKYKALSRAYSELTLGANEHYDGIADALALYATASEAYNTRTETITSEITATVSVMCSARADFDGVKYVIAAFKKRYD